MDILSYLERIDTLNLSANSNVNAADYDSALIDLAQAYGLQRMLLTHVLSLKFPSSAAERPAGEFPDKEKSKCHQPQKP